MDLSSGKMLILVVVLFMIALGVGATALVLNFTNDDSVKITSTAEPSANGSLSVVNTSGEIVSSAITLEGSKLSNLEDVEFSATLARNDKKVFTSASLKNSLAELETAVTAVQVALKQAASITSINTLNTSLSALASTVSGINISDMGTFAGTTIADNVSLKVALSSLETKVELPTPVLIDTVSMSDVIKTETDAILSPVDGQTLMFYQPGTADCYLCVYRPNGWIAFVGNEVQGPPT
jgi:hypothetical protein